jgi:cyclase
MPAFRIVPCLDVHAGRVVKGVRFANLRDMGDPVELAGRYRDEGADELVFLDVSATVEERRALVRVVESVAEVLDVPFTVGGGVSTDEDAGALLHAGADRVSVNSAAVAEPMLLDRMARRFGAQCVVLAIDAREVRQDSVPPPANDQAPQRGRRWEVVTRAGTEATGLDVVRWARESVAHGAGEILLTSMDRDGTGAGFDLDLVAAVRAAVEVPIIASGGGETAAHFAQAARAGADAGLAATIFHEAMVSIGELKRRLAAAGIDVRREEA